MKVFTVEQSVITHAKCKIITNVFGVKSITKEDIIINMWVSFNTNLLTSTYKTKCFTERMEDCSETSLVVFKLSKL